MVYQSIAEQLEKTGICIWPNFLDQECLHQTNKDFNELFRSRTFKRAATGLGSGQEIRDLRRDETYWFDRGNSTPAQQDLWGKLDALQLILNRSLFLGISHFDGHYSSYPVGGFYKRHLDNFQDNNTRIVSLIIYLNQNWQQGDEGSLRIYHENNHTDINPVGGTLVCFLSKDTEHEVLQTNAARKSFTGWFSR